MTVIEKSHFYLEIGKILVVILDALSELESVHHNWLQEAKNALENSSETGRFTVSLADIQNIKDSFIEGDFCATYFGINQLHLLFYCKRYYFDDSKSEEEHLGNILRDNTQTFRKYADSYTEDKLSAMSEQDQQKFLTKLRKWSLIREQGANSTNEISALIRKESTTTPNPILLEISLAKEIYNQANYQHEEHLQDLSMNKIRLLNDFIACFESAELQSWTI